MGAEANKRTALRILEAIAAHDAKVFEDCLHEDATFWTCGEPGRFPPAGRKSRAETVAYMATPSPYEGGGVNTARTVVAEGDRVAMESYNSGKAADGRVYANTYVYLLTFQDGKVIEIKEYFDTLAAMDFMTPAGGSDRGT